MKRLTVLLLTMFFCVAGLLAKEDGFIDVVRGEGTYKFVIPDSLLGKDVLFGSRVVDISSPNAKVYSAGQMRTPPVLVRFVKEGDLMFINEVTDFIEVDVDDPILNPLERNRIVGSTVIFDIEGRTESQDGSVIDVTRFFSEEVQLAWPLPDNVKKGKLEGKVSGIEFMREFKDHVNIRSYYEFHGGRKTFAITVQYFLMLLPPRPLECRQNDERIGYQPYSRKRFKSGSGVETMKYISRWRIEPHPDKTEEHKNGQVVEPANPIVMYIEPYFPKEWIPYIKMGIEDWNSAFEKIGFKNVMIAKEFPKDSLFDPYDVKTNVVRYLPLQEANAAGQIWTDPRSGEILNGEVLWWNDVVNLINMWRFTQTAAVDKRARALTYGMDLTGEMIRYAIAHEVGHVLGLQHNMRSSYAYPVDSLRSATFTSEFGTTASIMDYARNNHIAQPGDYEKGVKLTPPVLGPFDYFSIEYGYRYIHGNDKESKENEMLESLFDKAGGNPLYLFAPFQASAIPTDPSAQSETLGNNVIESSANGISNTRIIIDSLVKWTVEAGGDTQDVQSRFDALSKQYFRYISLVGSYVGGVYDYPGPLGKVKHLHVDTDKQKEAIRFVVEQLYQAPLYLENKAIFDVLGSKRDQILEKQGEVLSSLLNNFLLPRIVNNNALFGEGFDLTEYLEYLDNCIWEISSGNDLYDRNMRVSYVKSLAGARNFHIQGNEIRHGYSSIIDQAIYIQLDKTNKKLNDNINKNKKDNLFYKYLLNIIRN